MLRYLLILVFFFISGCASVSKLNPNWIVMSYSDFGPQVIAHEIIGMEWWQWQDHGDSIDREYAIQVVVYQGVSNEAVRQEFPVEPERQIDYRYLEYQRALDYLDEKIDEDVMENVTEKLKSTREKIKAHFN